jgi:DNA polymerase-3 subunit epsilon
VTGWHEGPLLAYDTESTGTSPTEDRIVTACVVALNDGPPRPTTWLLDPGIDIPAEATAVHGITTEQAREHGADPAVTLPQIRDRLVKAWQAGIPVVAYNASYDLTILDADLRRHGHGGIAHPGPVIDPLVLDRGLDRYRRGKRTLTAACEHYQVRLDGAHDATFDALAAARVAWRIATQYPDVATLPLEKLHELHAGMHREWATHFQEYLRGKGSDEVIDTAWPIRAAAAATASG